MPDIPSLGVSSGNFFDPGLVNVESQAYPRPLDLAQALAQNLGRLLPASTFAANPPPVPLQSGYVPTDLYPQSQILAQSPVSQSLGVAVVIPPEVDVEAQNVVRQPIQEFLVTESGNFATNETVYDRVSLTISSVVTLNGAGNAQTKYQIFFGTSNLFDFGIPLMGREVSLPSQAPTLAPEQAPDRTILMWSTNWIIVSRNVPFGAGDTEDILPSVPTAGQQVIFDVRRTGFEVVFDTYTPDSNVNVLDNVRPPVAETVVGESRQVVDVVADDGVVSAFVGGGVRVPALLVQNLRETAYFPSDRPIATLGLPVNVLIG